MSLVGRTGMRVIAAVVVVGLASTSAFADPPGMTAPLPPAPPTEPVVDSYRMQTAAADVVTLTLALSSSHHPDLGRIALGTYLLGAPAVHFAHGRGGRGLVSIAMRVGIPLTTALLLASGHTGSSCDVDCTLDGIGEVIVGLGLGALTASVIDTAFLAGADAQPSPPAPSWGPQVAPVHSGFTFGVGGSF